jgi:hypothetical protein
MEDVKELVHKNAVDLARLEANMDVTNLRISDLHSEVTVFTGIMNSSFERVQAQLSSLNGRITTVLTITITFGVLFGGYMIDAPQLFNHFVSDSVAATTEYFHN